MVLRVDSVFIYYDARDGKGYVRYIAIEGNYFDQFSRIRFAYSTNKGAAGCYMQVDDIEVTVKGNAVQPPPLAGTRTWTGAKDGLWSTAFNWRPYGPPSAIDSVIFASGAASCTLDVHDTVGSITFTPGYTGNFHFADTLTVMRNADLSSGGTITPIPPLIDTVKVLMQNALLSTMAGSPSPCLRFCGNKGRHFFIPNENEIPPVLKMGRDVLTVLKKPLITSKLSVMKGELRFETPGLTHTIYGDFTAAGKSVIDLDRCTIRVSGEIDTRDGRIKDGKATITYIGDGANIWQCGKEILPLFVMAGAGRFRIAATGTCETFLRGFTQTNGTFDFKGGKYRIIGGGFIVINGGPTSFENCAGSTITVLGNASLSGRPGNLLNMNPPAPWTIAVTGWLKADYANIANCRATLSPGIATNSVNGGGNYRWRFNCERHRDRRDGIRENSQVSAF